MHKLLASLLLVFICLSINAEKKRIVTSTEYGFSAIIYAAQVGNIEIIKKLIDKGADVNSKAQGGMSALMCASQNPNPEVMRILIENGRLFIGLQGIPIQMYLNT